MNIRFRSLLPIATVLLATSSFAQTANPEIEPNSLKSEATVAASGGAGMVSGDTINGTSTGTTTTLGSTILASVDMFRVKTAAQPLGIYKHRLVLTTTGAAGHTGTLRGLTQTGTIGIGGTVTTVDIAFQTSSTATVPARFNQWYGFGKQEEMYYRVSGVATTTAAYVATLTTTTVAAGTVAGPFTAGPITINTNGLTTVDTEIHLFDSNLVAIPGANNDGTFGVGLAPSTLSRCLPAGTYYFTISSFNTATNLASPGDDQAVTDNVLDFPDSLASSSGSLTSSDWDFSVSDGITTNSVTNSYPAPSAYEASWWTFTVGAAAAPANDNCASATVISTGSVTGNLGTATNDGVASCDPGGAAAKDVWYSFTNSLGGASLFKASTCGSTGVDTVLTVYSSCGGAELVSGCNDDCGGSPCGGPTSCVSISLATSQSVIIRVSDKGLGGGCFILNTSNIVLPPVNDDCSAPIVLTGPGLYPINNSMATTGTQGQGNFGLCDYQSSSPAIPRDLWYTYTPTTSGTVTVTTCGFIPVPPSPSTDSKIAVYLGAGCPAALAIGCNDDSGEGGSGPTCTAAGGGLFNSTLDFPTTCGATYTIQIGMYAYSASSILGQFSVTETGGACATPFTTSCYGDGSGTACPCSNAGIAGRGCGNGSFPSGAELSSTGIASISGDTLVLHGLNGSAFGAGLYFQGSANTSPAGAPFGHGIVCMSGATPRLEIVNPQDVNGASQTAGIIHNEGGISSPGTYNYQWWYRDAVNVGTCSSGGSAFNFSNAITLIWGP